MEQVGRCGQCAGGIVGVGDRDEPRGRRKVLEQDLERKRKARTSRHAHDLGTAVGRLAFVHGKAWCDDQSPVTGLQVGPAEQVDGLVRAVGEQDLLLREAEKLGHDPLARLTVRVAAEALGIELAQPFKHGRRGPSGAFVEVEQQAGTTAQRRLVRRRPGDECPRAQQGAIHALSHHLVERVLDDALGAGGLELRHDTPGTALLDHGVQGHPAVVGKR